MGKLEAEVVRLGQLENDVARLDAAQKVTTAGRAKEQAEIITTYLEKSDKKTAELATAIGKIEDHLARLEAQQKGVTAARDKEHAEAIKVLTASIKKSDNKVAKFATAIGNLQDDIDRLEAKQNDATAACDMKPAECSNSAKDAGSAQLQANVAKLEKTASASTKAQDEESKAGCPRTHVQDDTAARDNEHAEAIKVPVDGPADLKDKQTAEHNADLKAEAADKQAGKSWPESLLHHVAQELGCGYEAAADFLQAMEGLTAQDRQSFMQTHR